MYIRSVNLFLYRINTATVINAFCTVDFVASLDEIFNFCILYLLYLVSCLLDLFLRPVSSDHTDLIKEYNKIELRN